MKTARFLEQYQHTIDGRDDMWLRQPGASAWFAIALLGGALLAGCGFGDDNDTGQNTNTNPTNPTNVSNTDTSASETSIDPTQPTTNGPTATTTDPTNATTDPSGTTTDASTGGCNFSCAADMRGSWIECDVFAQNCNSPDEKCTAWAEGGGGAWNAAKCVKVTGTGIAGDKCTTEGGGVSGMDDCAKGHMCWNVNDKNEGICVALCTGTAMAPMCAPKFKCAIANDGVLNLCLPECDPLLQDCAGTDLCIPNGDKFICVLDASGEMGKQNDPCEFANSCDKGLVCLNTAAASKSCMQGSQGCCSPFCDFSMMGACPNPDQKCVQWFDPMMPIPPGLEDVGVCAIPA